MRVLALLSLSLLLACAEGPYVRVQPINAYRAYGDYHPAAEDEAVVKKSETANPAASNVRIIQEALPPGIEMKDGTLGVRPGFKHKLIGKYAYSPGEEVPKDKLVTAVKKMCVTTGANAALVIFQLVPSDHQDRAQGIEAVLVWLAPDDAPADVVPKSGTPMRPPG